MRMDVSLGLPPDYILARVLLLQDPSFFILKLSKIETVKKTARLL